MTVLREPQVHMVRRARLRRQPEYRLARPGPVPDCSSAHLYPERTSDFPESQASLVQQGWRHAAGAVAGDHTQPQRRQTRLLCRLVFFASRSGHLDPRRSSRCSRGRTCANVSSSRRSCEQSSVSSHRYSSTAICSCAAQERMIAPFRVDLVAAFALNSCYLLVGHSCPSPGPLRTWRGTAFPGERQACSWFL
jgi:hypothetical protein